MSPLMTDFYSAHFKIEVIRALASGSFGSRIGIVDLDTVFLRKLPKIVHDSSSIVAYDISSEFFLKSSNRARSDLDTIAGRKLVTRGGLAESF